MGSVDRSRHDLTLFKETLPARQETHDLTIDHPADETFAAGSAMLQILAILRPRRRRDGPPPQKMAFQMFFILVLFKQEFKRARAGGPGVPRM